MNKQFTRRIVGLKREESENILNFLYDHIAKGSDSQARVKVSLHATSLYYPMMRFYAVGA